MAVDNCNVTQFYYDVFEGDIVPAGIANLTISDLDGAVLDFTEFSIGGAGFAQGGWVGGNVDPQITKVVFTNNGDGTVNAAVHHNAFVVNNFMEVRIDIDRKKSDKDHDVSIIGCTDPNAVNYNPLAVADDGSCFFVNDPVGNIGDIEENHDDNVHGAEVEVPKENDPLLGDVVVSHGSNALFDVVLFDKTAGKKYDFMSGSFNAESKARSDAKRSIEQRSSGYSNIPKDLLFVNFPKVSSNTEYEFYIEPKSNQTKLASSVPTQLNPFKFTRRVDTTITLALTSSSYSGWWTIASSDVTFTDRPGKYPKATSRLVWPRDAKNNPLLTSDLMDGQPGYKYFNLTATFSASGGGSAKSASKSFDASSGSLSVPTVGTKEDDIVSLARLYDLTTTFSANVLTIKGLFKVDRFGTFNENFTIDIDNLITLS